MKLRSVLISTLGVAALAQFASPAGAVSLINENFNAVPQGLNQTGTLSGTSVGNSFTVGPGNVDVIGVGGPFDLYPTNGNYIDLNGNTGGTLTSSVFTVNPGGTLVFNYGSNGSATSANVFFGGLTLPQVNANSGSTFSTYNYTFSSAATGALSFVSNNGGAGGVIIDNVRLDTPTAVPEPSEIPGMLLFAGGALMLRRKYLAKKAK